MRFFAILPAAGVSQRMGQPKLLMPWGGRTIVEHVLAQWLGAGLERVVLVVRPDDQNLLRVTRVTGVDVVCPPQPPTEMKVSVAWGLRWLRAHHHPDTCDYWLLAPADMPTLSATTIGTLVSQVRRLATSDLGSAREILVPVWDGRRGHPVFFPWSCAEQVDQLGPNEGINALLRRYPVRELPAPTGEVLVDLDTPEDYRAHRVD